MNNYWAATFETANGAVDYFDACADAAAAAGLPSGFRPVDLWRSSASGADAPAPASLLNRAACDVGDWDICSDEAPGRPRLETVTRNSEQPETQPSRAAFTTRFGVGGVMRG